MSGEPVIKPLPNADFIAEHEAQRSDMVSPKAATLAYEKDDNAGFDILHGPETGVVTDIAENSGLSSFAEASPALEPPVRQALPTPRQYWTMIARPSADTIMPNATSTTLKIFR